MSSMSMVCLVWFGLFGYPALNWKIMCNVTPCRLNILKDHTLASLWYGSRVRIYFRKLDPVNFRCCVKFGWIRSSHRGKWFVGQGPALCSRRLRCRSPCGFDCWTGQCQKEKEKKQKQKFHQMFSRFFLNLGIFAVQQTYPRHDQCKCRDGGPRLPTVSLI